MGIRPHTVMMAGQDADTRSALEVALKRAGHTPVGFASSWQELVELVRHKAPQVLLLDADRPGRGCLMAIREIVRFGTTAIILMTADKKSTFPVRALDAGVCSYLSKPCAMPYLIWKIETSWFYFEMAKKLQGAVHELEDISETRGVLDKAKRILMEQQHLTEEKAHHTLQLLSQTEGIPLKDICRALIQVKMALAKSDRVNSAQAK